MLRLLRKEIMLSMHPVTPMMLMLSAMVMIPSYPYSVIFFYTTLSLFFTCMLGRENNDIIYTFTLPVPKQDIVRARIGHAVVLEVVQLVLITPFIVLRSYTNPMKNEAGMEANIALIGVGLLIYGLFNFTFFTRYYKNVAKVGSSFVWSSAFVFLAITIGIICTRSVPFVRDYLDTKDPEHLLSKLVFLAAGVGIYTLLTFSSYKKSVKSFEKQDL